MSHRPRKRFGQNFLRDAGVILNIVAAINPKPHNHLVEIGPGQGALTFSILDQCKFLDIIELDRDLVAVLDKKLQGHKSVGIYSGDALEFDFGSLQRSDEKLRIFGNLPYNISTPLLFRLLNFSAIMEDFHLMLQKEVAERICAIPGNKNYAKLSVMTQVRCGVEKLFEVGPECFTPSPKVTSALVRLTPFPTPPVEIIDSETFKQTVSKAFGQRRKTLRNALKPMLSEKQISALGIDPTLRGESLDLEAFARLSNEVSKSGWNQ